MYLLPLKRSINNIKNYLQAQKLYRRRVFLKVEKTLERFQAVTEEDWKAVVFASSEINEGSLCEEPAGWDIIRVCNKNFSSPHELVNTVIDKRGGIELL